MCSCPVVRAALGRPLARYSSKMTASQWATWPAAVAQRAERGSVAVQARNRLQDLLADLRAEDTEVEENNVPVGKRPAAVALPPPAACTMLLVASLRGRGIVDDICSQFSANFLEAPFVSTVAQLRWRAATEPGEQLHLVALPMQVPCLPIPW